MTQVRTTIAAAALAVAFFGSAARADAEKHPREKPRRHFVTFSYDWLNTQPLHFANHPLTDLVGADVEDVHFEDFDYRTRDGATRIDVLEFKRHGQGAGVTVFPFGVSVGTALALRGSVEQLPVIRIAFDGPAAVSNYVLTNAHAYDAAVGIHVADHARGWGLGSHAFIAGGVGRITSDLSGGSRTFAEAGGGVDSGPLGVELSVKFAWNRLSEPVAHRFMTVPIALRATVSF